jgi:flagellar hook-associated protein 3 FlgL
MVDTNADGLYDVVNYQGDAGVMLRNIGPGQAITQNVDGNAALSPLFSAMISARDALNSNNTANLQAAAAALQAAIRNVSDAATVNGARQRQVRLSQDRLEKAQIELKSLLSQKEDANMAEVISSLRHQETVYQTVLEVGHRAISALSLFDMLS